VTLLVHGVSILDVVGVRVGRPFKEMGRKMGLARIINTW
jgi:hypothetical protein